jgi:hypothetical protein
MDRCQVAEQALRHRMALLVGALLAFAAGLFARASGLDRDRAFYPTVAIVIGRTTLFLPSWEHQRVRLFSSRWWLELSLQ